jgi:hypothetical protein
LFNSLIQNDRTRLLKVARYLGGIREKRIPNYVYHAACRGNVYLGSVFTFNEFELSNYLQLKKLNPQQLKKYKKLKAMDDRDVNENHFQDDLYLLDLARGGLYKYFLHYIKMHPEDKTFIKELEKAAKLTKEEVDIFKNAKNIPSNFSKWPKVAPPPKDK